MTKLMLQTYNTFMNGNTFKYATAYPIASASEPCFAVKYKSIIREHRIKCAVHIITCKSVKLWPLVDKTAQYNNIQQTNNL